MLSDLSPVRHPLPADGSASAALPRPRIQLDSNLRRWFARNLGLWRSRRLYFFDDGWVGVVADLQIEHGVEAGGARQCNAQRFAVNGDGCWCHAVSVHDGRNLVLGEQAAGGGATERAAEAGFQCCWHLVSLRAQIRA